MSTVEDALESLNIKLPQPPTPMGSYLPVVQSGNLVFVSGQLPIDSEKATIGKYKGPTPSKISLEDAQQAAKICVINAIAHLKKHLGDLDKISRIVKISGYVNADVGFIEHPKVVDAASDFVYQLFGEKGKHSRIAVGTSSLPLDSVIEIDVIVEVS